MPLKDEHVVKSVMLIWLRYNSDKTFGFRVKKLAKFLFLLYATKAKTFSRLSEKN